MNEPTRHTADTITDDALEALYDERDRYRYEAQEWRSTYGEHALRDTLARLRRAETERDTYRAAWHSARDRAHKARTELATMTHVANINGEGHRHAYQAYQAALRIVSAWCYEANTSGGIDAGDLAWRLEDAGHPLPDTEGSEA